MRRTSVSPRVSLLFWNHRRALPMPFHVQTLWFSSPLQFSFLFWGLRQPGEIQAGGQSESCGCGHSPSSVMSVLGNQPSLRFAHGSLHRLSTTLHRGGTSGCCSPAIESCFLQDCYFQNIQEVSFSQTSSFSHMNRSSLGLSH